METAAISQFWNDGALLLKNVFSVDEMTSWRKKIEQSLPRWQAENLIIKTPQGGRLKTDLLANALLSQLLLDPRMIALAKALLGTKPIYFGDSTFVFGPTSRGWHRDNRTSDRNNFKGLDWEGHYPLIRIGFYLQDHENHSGGLGIRLKSHLAHQNPLIDSRFIPRRVRSFLAHHTGKPMHMDSSPGDLVIWTLRTLHSADAVRLKGLPRLRLSPFLENRLPTFAQVKRDGNRMACFMTFAASSDHLDRYLDYLMTRDYMPETWKQSIWDDNTLKKADSAGIQVIQDKISALMAKK